MSAVDLSKIRAVRPVIDMHPHWCRSDERDSSSVAEHRYLGHSSNVTTFGAQANEVEVSLHLNRGDEVIGTVQHTCRPALALSITNHSVGGTADVHLDVEEAELLERFLHSYIERLRCGFGDLPRLEGDDD